MNVIPITAAPPRDFAFHCSACGQCCNTPPLLTLDELLRFESRFIGALALRRVRRLAPGDVVAGTTLDADDLAAQHSLFDALLYPAPAGSGEVLQISLQAIDYPSLNACPALDDTRLCSLHAGGKPGACEVVPLDALQADRLQHAVLASRQRDYLDADCIIAGSREGFAALTTGGAVVDPAYHVALQQQRAAIAADKARWGQPLHAALTAELHAPAMWQRIPYDGFFNLSPVPLLALLAASAPHMPARCLQFIDAQLRLIDTTLAAALARKRPTDRPMTQQLRGYADAYRKLRPSLVRAARIPNYA
ncbi:hypothetical protein [Jeongeupia sp. HS-3]|uniref:hypothetical protein n=1 Tax=Jeongeupia sp. HS-3 TaxID=1009682 RepID=UPI00190FE510|nr:hypothetical protein [Jeongeupia sp. HS-3]